ncbi:MAG: hypothetical protein MUE71_11375 [Chitinophagaceae bacterium]|nr:hypothetical protein [Chitinophagaceae bacterium]
MRDPKGWSYPKPLRPLNSGRGHLSFLAKASKWIALLRDPKGRSYTKPLRPLNSGRGHSLFRELASKWIAHCAILKGGLTQSLATA